MTQMDIVWEDKEKNMEKARKLVEQAAKQDVELLVFPEMTFTGFTMNTALAGEEMLFSPTIQIQIFPYPLNGQSSLRALLCNACLPLHN